MAEKASTASRINPGRCALAHHWASRVADLESADCPFGLCVLVYPAGVPGGSQTPIAFLRSIHDYGCREWQAHAMLETPK